MDENTKSTRPEAQQPTPVALDDERRIKVMSPGMLVFKRFVRNKLAIVGTIIIVSMFIFSFLGVLVNPYSESQVFRSYYPQLQDYAAVTINEEYRYTVAPGQAFDNGAKAKMILAIQRDETAFDFGGKSYGLAKEGDQFYRITEMQLAASGKGIKNKFTIVAAEGNTLPENFQQVFDEAIAAGETDFELDGVNYTIKASKMEAKVYTQADIALASMILFEGEENKEVPFEVCLATERTAQNPGVYKMDVDSVTYEAERVDDTILLYTLPEGGERQLYATASRFAFKESVPGTVLTPEFRQQAQDAVLNGTKEFTVTGADGNAQEFVVERKDKVFSVRHTAMTYLVSDYEGPSAAHWLGTDGNGMDMLTRLMYGGRISLMIGFIVVIIETFIGVVLGGVAGYFGKWVDNLLMRVVDVFNCIPGYPIYIILGSIMDEQKVDPTTRLLVLMAAMGILGWPYIARIVRGQILSLREKEFMTATEATGISVSRRIFRHLVPNVIPQLIVVSTMSLGGVILAEATLSFLGIGVKYPMASWGSIINAVSNAYVMTNYWFVWIPAGMLILLTVLGFNFIGDGLRDAFDPKMKR